VGITRKTGLYYAHSESRFERESKSRPPPLTQTVRRSSENKMSAKRKTFKEEFARFYESPTREDLRELLRNNLGEFPNIDFKEQWPEYPNLARHLLGMANSSGGCIVIGVSEKEDKTFESKGIDSLIDKTIVINGIKKFLPNLLLTDLEIVDFSYEAAEYPKLVGKKFQAVIVDGDPKALPFIALADGDGIRNNAIYVRRGPSSEDANYEELQRIINRRIETGYSTQIDIDLRTHMEQLKILYSHIDKYHVRSTGSIFEAMEAISMSVLGTQEKVPNPAYPKETFDEFVVGMIEKKKRRIAILLNVIDL